MTFPEWIYLMDLNSWYMMYTLWMFLRIPLFMTLCKSLSENIRRKTRFGINKVLIGYLFVWIIFVYPCIQKQGKYPDRYLLCANPSIELCYRDWRMKVKTWSREKCAERPSDFWRHRISFSPLLFFDFFCPPPSTQSHMPEINTIIVFNF